MDSFELMNPLIHSFLHGVEFIALIFVALYFVLRGE